MRRAWRCHVALWTPSCVSCSLVLHCFHIVTFNHGWISIWYQSCALKASWRTVKLQMFSFLSWSQFVPPETVISCVKTEWASGTHPERASAVTLLSPDIGSWRGIHVHLSIKVSRWVTSLCNFIHIEECACVFKQLFAVYIWYHFLTWPRKW